MPPEHHETVSLSGPGARLAQGRGARTALRVAVGIACVALLVGGSYLLWDRVVAPLAAVPQLIGSSRTQAQARLQQRGLSLEIGAERNRLREPAGQVIGQRPSPGGTLRDGSLVEVALSLGPAVVSMPDFKGQKFEDIIGELQANAFDLAAPSLVYDDTAPAGQVISHDPPAATPIRQGSAITVTVSQGPGPVDVPAVQGRPLTRARADVEQAGLGTLSLHEVFSDEVPQAGTIISQSLTAGTQVARGTPMTVTVSQGPLTIPLPQTRGLRSAQAVAALEQAGLVALPVTEPVPMVGPYEMIPSDLVRGSVPAAGDVVQRGQSVEIYYFTPR